MNHQRRSVLKLGTALGLAVSAGFLTPMQAWAVQEQWNEKAFGATDVDSVLASLGGRCAVKSAQDSVIAPDISVNCVVVPVSDNSALRNTSEIAFLVPYTP